MGNVKQIEELTQDLIDGNLQELSLDDSFAFSCKSCGNCCSNCSIIVNSYDIIRMRRSLGFPTTTMVAEDLLCFNIGPNSKMPIASLKFRQMGPLKVCPFLSPVLKATAEDAKLIASGERSPVGLSVAVNDYGSDLFLCGVYGDRPLHCRLYPVGRLFMHDKDDIDLDTARVTWFLAGPNDFCNGVVDSPEKTLGAWIQGQQLQDYLSYSKECIAIMKRLSSSKVLEAEGEHGKRATSLAFTLLYNFDEMLEDSEEGKTWIDYSDAEIIQFISTSIDTLIQLARK